MTDGYFTNNPHIDRLCAAVQLVDSRLGLTADDEAMVTFLRGNDIPFFAVATKIDKLNATERRENLAAIAAHPLLTGVQVIPFSALRGEGRNELLSVIGGLPGLKFGKCPPCGIPIGAFAYESTLPSPVGQSGRTPCHRRGGYA